MMRLALPAIAVPEADEIDVAAAVRDHLGVELQAYFGEALTEALPERLLGLLTRFEVALAARGQQVTQDFRAGLMKALPALRTFGFSLTGDATRTDDLVQETLVKAWANQHRFQPGSNMVAWLFTIMRNQFYSEIRKGKREVEDAEGAHAARLTAQPEQDGVIALKRLYAILAKVPAAQREALLLVGAEGYTYEEAAARLQCQVGTVKSRVSRARTHLAGLLGFDDAQAAVDGI
ncbi:sigma-70 family RNA polymerase sigma factor [Methylobacterium soli]|nr:hypothetical protein AEGHOMDF_4363 [Methylobacterium soli]